MQTPRSLLAGLLLAGLLSAPATAQDSAPEWTTEGLQRVEKDRRGEIYADPDIDWSRYTQVSLDRATVAFRRNWQRDQNRYQSFKVREQDMENIKNGLADLFDQVFTEELSTNGGYEIVQESGDQVMHLSPHIVDLDVYAPDTRTAGRSYTYTESAGRMTLKLAVYDSVTSDLIATVTHRQEAPRRGYMQWTTSVTNSAEARRMLQRWATGLRERLDQARGIER